MSDIYDDTLGSEVPDISDLIKEVEEVPTLEEFLMAKARSIEKADEPPKPIQTACRKCGSKWELRLNLSACPYCMVPVSAVKEAMQAPNYIQNGVKPSIQDAKPEGVPAPVVITEEQPIPVQAAEPAQEVTTVLELRNHPITGNYVSEQQVVVHEEDWYAEVFQRTYKMGVSEMTPEQIIDVIHHNLESVRKTNVATQSLRKALEHHLSGMNASKRAELLEKDQSYRSTRSKAKGEAKNKRSGTPASSSAKISDAKLQKTILAMKEKMFMTMDELFEELRDRQKLTDEVKKFVESLYKE